MNSLLGYTLAWCAMNEMKLMDARQWAVDLDTGEVLA